MPAKRIVLIVWIVLVLGLLAWMIVDRLAAGDSAALREGPAPAPVEVASVEQGTIELRRTFSGTLESPGQFVVAPKVSGRVVRLAADLADAVKRGQIVAELDDDEYVQAVAQAEAELAVARATRSEAESSLEIANRELKRVELLRDLGIGSESELDVARADQLAKQAALKVSGAQVERAEAALNTAKIRLGYTRVAATWTGGDGQRVVARRHVDEGDTVAANAPLFTIVELNPITAVIYLTGKDYGQFKAGQPVTLVTDTYPTGRFTGQVARVAPVFQAASRQARAELTVANPQDRLKPGMFVRAEAVLAREENATIVPLAAMTKRAGQDGVFIVSNDGRRVRWRPVEVAIQEGERVQVIGGGVAGRVVTLGQQLLDDGSPITIPEQESEPANAETNR